MPQDVYETDHYDHNEGYEDEYYEETSDDEYFDEDESLYTPEQQDTPSFLPPVNWRRIKLGQTILEVSDQGCVRPNGALFGATKGFPLIGTPYLTYPVELEQGVRKEYFVHDLIWWGFNGPTPQGWEVRHTFHESSKRRKYYSNALQALTISPATVEIRPTFPVS